jgi:hypothetical protein
MTEDNDRTRAAEALTQVREHQERTRRATRTPWWVYAAAFVLTAALTAANDFVDLSGSRAVAALVLVALVVVVAVTLLGRSSILGRLRGVERRQAFEPRLFLAAVVVAGGGVWLVTHYGTGLAGGLARSVGLGAYPNTVLGILYGAVFTALVAGFQAISAAHQRRAER